MQVLSSGRHLIHLAIPRSGLSCTSKVKHAQLAVHLGRLKLRFEPVQQVHHLRVQFKVRKVIVHPEQENTRNLTERKKMEKELKLLAKESIQRKCILKSPEEPTYYLKTNTR